MKKINSVVIGLAVAAAVFLCAGCGDSGVQSGNGEAVEFLNRFSWWSGGSGTRGRATLSGDLLTDIDDGKTYKTAVIGGKRWMAQNLNYQTIDSSWCYDNDNANCNKYGRLYVWGSARWGACPTGWHLPSADEWSALVNAAGGEDSAAKELKMNNGWKNRENGTSGNGSNKFGFSALPGRYYNTSDGLDEVGRWWTASIRAVESGGIGGPDPDYMSMSYNSDRVYKDDYSYDAKLSVRCVMDD